MPQKNGSRSKFATDRKILIMMKRLVDPWTSNPHPSAHGQALQPVISAARSMATIGIHWSILAWVNPFLSETL